MILADALIRRGVEITVLESPAVEIIGVGEGSTPWLRGFFDSLGIEESRVDAGVQRHVQVRHHVRRAGRRSRASRRYFHPFASMLDNLTMTQFVHNARRARERRRRLRPSRPLLHRLAPGRRAPGAEAGQQLPVRHLVRLPLRCGAAGQVPAQEGARARRQVQELPRRRMQTWTSAATSPRSRPGRARRSPRISSSTARVSRRC